MSESKGKPEVTLHDMLNQDDYFKNLRKMSPEDYLKLYNSDFRKYTYDELKCAYNSGMRNGGKTYGKFMRIGDLEITSFEDWFNHNR